MEDDVLEGFQIVHCSSNMNVKSATSYSLSYIGAKTIKNTPLPLYFLPALHILGLLAHSYSFLAALFALML